MRLSVRDDGPGVPLEARARVFERYVRLDPEAADAGVGGLGLSVVRWVAETHGGTAELIDSSDGACFEVVLPAAERPAGATVV